MPVDDGMSSLVLPAGRWKGALVAVKVIDHRIKGNGNAVDIQRETILSTSVVHPNVVSSCLTCVLKHVSKVMHEKRRNR